MLDLLDTFVQLRELFLEIVGVLLKFGTAAIYAGF